ncbi:MAG: hypothetical protein KGL39_19920 [Patescibacteria group bacterium]|nr:hypothetical protein [Patescibacteria group bacterium]
MSEYQCYKCQAHRTTENMVAVCAVCYDELKNKPCEYGHLQKRAEQERDALAAACAAMKAALENSAHALRHVACIAGSETEAGLKLRDALGKDIWYLVQNAEPVQAKALSSVPASVTDFLKHHDTELEKEKDK